MTLLPTAFNPKNSFSNPNTFKSFILFPVRDLNWLSNVDLRFSHLSSFIILGSFFIAFSIAESINVKNFSGTFFNESTNLISLVSNNSFVVFAGFVAVSIRSLVNACDSIDIISGVFSMPTNLAIIVLILSHNPISSTLIVFNLFWSSGLINTSATNSFKFLKPYNCSRNSLAIFSSFTVNPSSFNLLTKVSKSTKPF